MRNSAGIDWLECWLDQYVPMEGGDINLARAFVKQLLRDANAHGYTLEDMNLVGTDLVHYMQQAMNVTPAGRYDEVLLI